MTENRKLAACTLAAIAAHAVIAVATLAWLGSFGDLDVGAVAWSHDFYFENASRALRGELPYRDFLFEYPVLSFPLFLIPRLLTSDFASYRIAFVVEMLLFDAAAVTLVARQVREDEGIERVTGRLAWYTAWFAILGPLVVGRFELAPMLLAFAAARWWFGRRSVLGGVAAGLGTLMKVFPGVVAALALVWEVSKRRREDGGSRTEDGVRRGSPDPAGRRRTEDGGSRIEDNARRGSPDPAGGPTEGLLRRLTQVRGTAAFLATLTVGLVFWFALGGRRVLDSLGYHADRGLEIGSLYAGGLLLWGTISGIEVPWVFNYRAHHVVPEWGARLAGLALPIQSAALLLVVGRFWRSSMSEGIRYAAAAVLAFIITGKVLSPQYLIWLFPFLAVLAGPTGRLARQIFLLGCLTTTLIYPGPGFPGILDHQAGAILLLNLRNVLLVWLLAILLFGPVVGGDPGGHVAARSESAQTVYAPAP
jgi:Glycosyltransferase family 87